MSDELKKYTAKRPILFTPNAADRLGIDNRLIQAGEVIELPDDMAARLMKKTSITLVVEKPAVRKPAAKKATKKEVDK